MLYQKAIVGRLLDAVKNCFGRKIWLGWVFSLVPGKTMKNDLNQKIPKKDECEMKQRTADGQELEKKVKGGIAECGIKKVLKKFYHQNAEGMCINIM